MNSDLWDTADAPYQDHRHDLPFWALPLDSKDEADEKSVHQWLLAEIDHLKYVNRDRFHGIHKNLALYKGFQYRDQNLRIANRDGIDEKNRIMEKLVLHHLYDLSKSRVSKLLKYKPAVAILPTSDEWEDDIAAKMTKAWLDHIWYEERFDGIKIPKFVQYSQPMGEAFLFIDWDADKGGISKQYKDAVAEARKRGKGSRVPLLDQNGQQQTDSNENPIWIDQPIYNGDVTYRVKMTLDVLAQRVPSGDWEDVKYIFVRDVMNVHEARLRWPTRAENIKSEKDASFYDFEKMETFQDGHLVEIWTMSYKRSKELDKGRKVVFTKDGILENTRFPFSHKNLPCKRFTDLDIPGELHGRSFFDLVKGSTGAHNNLTNMILRNMTMVGHPKWMMPAGAAKVESLGNAITIVQYKGPIAPQLVSSPTTPREVFEFRNMLKEEFMQHADVSTTGRGDPPPGITAAVALQYLSELENERWNESVLKYNECILQTAIDSIAVAGDRYEEDDHRMMRLLGKNNKWMSVAIDIKHLTRDYDIRLQSSSALPESKAARTEYILYLNERFPDRVGPDEVLHMLDISNSEKFMNNATVSVRAAEAENEMLMSKNDKEVNPPSEEEDQIEHWKIHIRQMREWAYKNMTPQEVKDRFHDHVLATEMLIIKKALTNPIYAEAVKSIALLGFPLLFQPLPTPDLEPDPGLAPMDPGMGSEGEENYDAPIEDTVIGDMPPEPVLEPGMPVNEDPANIGMQEFGAAPPLEPTHAQ
jgi:hypothetical protein